MPGWGLAPAAKVTAQYDSLTKYLTLHATGTVDRFMQDFRFERETIYGGLKYSFKCWYDEPHVGMKPLDYTQRFYLPDLQAITPSLTVIIVDLNHPKGQVIKIEMIMSAEAKAQTNGISTAEPSILKSAEDPGPVTIPIQSIPEPIEITAIYGKPFTISTSTGLTRTISELHNDLSLLLKTASYDKGNLSWTYDPLETGITEVVLTAESDIVIQGCPMITKTVYIIKVIAEFNILPFPPPDEILSFKGRVGVAQNLVKERYPSASLIFVDVTSHSPYPVTDPLRLSQMRCLFAVDNGTVSIISTGWGTFGPPVFFEYKILGLSPFKIEDCIDITDAANDMQKAGITEAFFRCELSEILISPAETANQPYYVFSMVDHSATYVGAKDGTVKHVPALLKALPGKAEGKKA